MALSCMTLEPLPTDNHVVHNKCHLQAVNLPENRLLYLNNREVLQPLYDHMNKHHKRIQAAQPPPPAAKVNVNVSQLVKSLLEMAPQSPETQGLLQSVTDLTNKAVGEKPQADNPPPQAAPGGRAPGMQPGAAQQAPPEGMAPQGETFG